MADTQDKKEKIEKALDRLREHEEECRLCPRDCRVNRRKGEQGFCQSGIRASLARALLHYGEEPVLSGYRDWRQEVGSNKAPGRSGSGTIFFTGCNLKCLFCQNYELSWLHKGRAVSDEELAALMLGLEEQGALNINLVTPTHVILPILRGLHIACSRGLRLPLVWNSSGYEKPDVLALLEGIVDIYLPDLKYFSPDVSARLAGAPDYFSWAGPAIKEMFRQQPELLLNEKEMARRGLIVRHLVLPGQAFDSLALLEWMRLNLPPSVCLSLMSQYHPCHKAPEDLKRPLSKEEYQAVIRRAEELGFENLFIQPEGFRPDEHLVPDFSRPDPFGWEG